MTKRPSLLLSCEHGGNRIPDSYQDLFRGKTRLLRSHRAFDTGSLALARNISRDMEAPLHFSEVTRLLVDLNRSLHHKNLFSTVSGHLPEVRRNQILKSFYLPYRERVVSEVGRLVSEGACVIHISVHSFVPVLNGTVRNADIGLLYDPRRVLEKNFCRAWKAALQTGNPPLRTRLNYPYLGKADGLTTWLRRQFPGPDYLGIELELNQGLVGSPALEGLKAVSKRISESLSRTWEGWSRPNAQRQGNPGSV
ncbi:MAG: N-formylglutamate amidohydrolase [Thermodesulfobacteriota bacterium]